MKQAIPPMTAMIPNSEKIIKPLFEDVVRTVDPPPWLLSPPEMISVGLVQFTIFVSVASESSNFSLYSSGPAQLLKQ
jgi:hypothetical protein